MSGGAYDYVSFRLTEAADTLRARHPDKPHVRALAAHMGELADLLHDIEWADSGDTSWDEALDAHIRAILLPGADVAETVAMARQLHGAMGAALASAPEVGHG